MMEMRKSCKNCAIKHVAQALVLLHEAVKGYPEHVLIAIGHLAEAEDETVQSYPELTEKIRNIRLGLFEDRVNLPNLLPLLIDIDSTQTNEEISQ